MENCIHIQAEGIDHKQQVTTKEDIEILKAVCEKVIRDAEKLLQPNHNN